MRSYTYGGPPQTIMLSIIHTAHILIPSNIIYNEYTTARPISSSGDLVARAKIGRSLESKLEHNL